jgi:hypothetical protein
MPEKIDNGVGLYAILEYKSEFKNTISHSGTVYEALKIHIVRGVNSFFMSRLPNGNLYKILTSSEDINNLTGRYPNEVGVLNIRESKRYLCKQRFELGV